MSFAATLRPRERRLAGRLEGFGDIVFGFAVSQCALQLPTVQGHADIAQPASLLLYFGTFALLAWLWLTYHRMLSGTYRPTPIDLTIAFAYLGIVSLMPFAQYSVWHHVYTVASTRASLAEYTIIFSALTGLAAVLTLRNLRRGWHFIDDDERQKTWLGFLLRSNVCVAMLAACIVDLALSPIASNLAFGVMIVANRILRVRVTRAPSSALLRIAGNPQPVA